MQLLAVESGNAITGAFIIGTFALGTMPGLLGIGGLTSIVKGIFAKHFFKFASIVVILLSIFNIANGYRLIGLNSGGQKQPVSSVAIDPNVTMENGVQAVKMTEQSRGYSPNKFTIRKGVPVKWVIDARDPYSCASNIVIPKLNMQKH